MNRPEYCFRQSGVVPFRGDGRNVQVLLITSHSGKRWILPKGVVEPGLTPEESAARQAEEGPGVRGRVRPQPIGTYERDQWGGTCRIEVFPLEVQESLEDWPEAGIRERRWVTTEEARRLVKSSGLRRILRRLAEALERHDR